MSYLTRAVLLLTGSYRLAATLMVAALCCTAGPPPVMSAEAAPAIAFSLQDLDGRTHTLSDYRGKWVVVNFWATTCPPCIREMPELSAFHNRHKDRDAIVLGVNFEDIRESWMRRFLKSVDVSYPVLPWGTAPATPFGQVFALPTTFIVSPDGTTVARYTGTVTAADIEAYIAGQGGTGKP